MEELKEQLKQGIFYYHKSGLLVKGTVISVELLEGKNKQFNIDFEGGQVSVFYYDMSKILRPGNIIANFEWCYKLRNEYNEEIGYIGKVKEK